MIPRSRAARSSTARCLTSVPNDDSGILSVIPSALFISKAVGATGSPLLSFAGGDTASLLGPSHSDAAWAAGRLRLKVSKKEHLV